MEAGWDSTADHPDDVAAEPLPDVPVPDATQEAEAAAEAASDAPAEAGGDAESDAAGEEDGPTQDAADDAETSVPFRIRVVAANLTSGTAQSWDPGEGLRILQGLKPDVALVQEFNYGANTAADWQAFALSALGPGASVYREPDGQIPNGIVSRYPILQSGEWEDPYVDNRDFAWARIDLPGVRDLWAVSVHLLTSTTTERAKQAQALMGNITSQIPEGDLVVLGGDFNTDSRTESCLTALEPRFVTAGPWPQDQSSNSNTNRNRNKPYDWVVASPSLHALATAVTLGQNGFTDGLVFDSRVYVPLTDVAPVLLSDSNAANMQHMAVVRDFLIP